MKSQGILLRFWVLTLLFSVALMACAQQPKKKENAASSKVEITNKSLKKNAADKDTAAKKKNTAKRTEQGTVQAKNAAKTTASKKQAAGRGKAQTQGKEKTKGKPQAQGKEKNKDKKIVKGEKQVQLKGNRQAGKPAPSAEAKAAARRPVQATGKQQQQKRQQQKKQQPKKQKQPKRYVALKSNIPFQALSMHSLAVEVQVHKQVTVDFPVMWSISDIEREHAVRGIAFQPEGRWWLKKAGTGHFFGIHAHATWFNLKWEDNRYQTDKRPLLGAGISYGYKLPLSAHWGAEFNIGAGYANMKYDTFYNVENGAQLDTRIRNYWGITRVGISLVYRF